MIGLKYHRVLSVVFLTCQLWANGWCCIQFMEENPCSESLKISENVFMVLIITTILGIRIFLQGVKI